MSSAKKSGGCLKNLLLTVVVILLISFIKEGGLNDLFSSFSKDDVNGNYSSYDTCADDTYAYDTVPGGAFSDVTTALTQTRPQVTEAPELKNVPSDLKENVYLDYIGGGYCEKFSGNIEINVIFVTDNDSKWDQTAKSKAAAEIQDQKTLITNTAASSGITVNISVRYHEGELIGQSVVNENVDVNWRNTVLNSAGLGDVSVAQSNIESSRGVSSAPLVFLFNTRGRATASHQLTGRIGVESIILYSSGISSLFHEMCHLYGAKDFYYPNDVKALADKYLPDSIMNSGDKVDPLTAFVIGWTDTLSSSATSFLRETSYITNEYLNEKHKIETLSGYAEDHEYSGGRYTGYLNNGWPDGEGTLRKSNGSYYSGTWDYGQFLQGECVIYYENGACYSGDLKNGAFNGYGVMKYVNGDSYSGNWKDGNRHGYGVYVFRSGTKEEGYYVNGKGNGQFVIYYSDGTVFRGTKVDGQLSGYGETTYTDGTWFKGNWENGKRNGYGEMKYSNGSIYKGNFYDGQRHGQGTMYYANGTVYTGNWSNGDASGQGTMNYENGDSYTGGWKNGKRHGYGTYTWASGSVKSGNWSNGEFVG